MQRLRDGCAKAGLGDVRTVLATGNLICRSALGRDAVRTCIEEVIARHDLSNPVVMRTPDEIAETMAACPFKDAAADRPSKLLIVYLDEHPKTGSVEELDLLGSERIARHRDAIYVDYCNGVADSKLTPNRITRVTGRIATARNWNTSGKLAALAGT